jgi:hypothetical protein
MYQSLDPENEGTMYFFNVSMFNEGYCGRANSQGGGLPLLAFPKLIIKFISSNPTYFGGRFLHLQPNSVVCHGDIGPT